MLRRDVQVAERLRFILGFVEDLIHLSRERWLSVGLLRIAAGLALDLLAQLRDVHAELLENGNDDAFVLRE